MKRVLITGIQGLIGWNLYSSLRPDYEVFGFSRIKPRGHGQWHDGLMEDFGRVRELLRQIEPDIVIHTQAVCNLDLCEIEPEKTWRVNVGATEALLNALDPEKHQFVHMSSEHVFSGAKGYYDENDFTDPISVYGRTRQEAERKVLKLCPKSLLIRPGLVLGNSFQGDIGPQDWFRSRLRKGLAASFFEDEFRSPIWIQDFVRGVKILIRNKAQGIFHLGGQERMSRYTLALRLSNRWNMSGDIRSKNRFDDKKVPRIGDCSLNSSKAMNHGWKIREKV